MREKRLQLSVPPVNGYLHHAFPLSIMACNEDYLPWFYSNYIQLYCSKNFDDLACPLNFYIYENFNNFSLLDCQMLTRDIVLSMTDILSFLTGSIDKGYHVSLYVDEYYIPNTKAYKKVHFTHDLLVSGYSKKNKSLFVSTYMNQKYVSTTITFREFLKSFKEVDTERFDYAELIRLFRYNNKPYPFNVGLTIDYLSDYLRASNHFRCASFPDESHLAFGVAIYHYLKRNLLADADRGIKEIDIRPTHILWEHKLAMKNRIEFLLDNQYIKSHEIYTEYSSIENSTQKIRLALIRYNISGKKDQIHYICNTLDQIMSQERTTLEKLLKELKEYSGV